MWWQTLIGIPTGILLVYAVLLGPLWVTPVATRTRSPPATPYGCCRTGCGCPPPRRRPRRAHRNAGAPSPAADLPGVTGRPGPRLPPQRRGPPNSPPGHTLPEGERPRSGGQVWLCGLCCPRGRGGRRSATPARGGGRSAGWGAVWCPSCARWSVPRLRLRPRWGCLRRTLIDGRVCRVSGSGAKRPLRAADGTVTAR